MTAHTCGRDGRSGCLACRHLEGALWEAINRYAVSVGGDPSRHVYGNTSRMQAVAEVDRAVHQMVAQRPGGGAPARQMTNPHCTGTVGRDFVVCGEEGYYCSEPCRLIGQLGAARARVAEYERLLGVPAVGYGGAGGLETGEAGSWLLVSATDLPREIDARVLNHVMYCIDRGAVFLELDRARCQEGLAWLAQLTGAVAQQHLRRSHPIVVVIPADFVLDRATRDQIIRAGGMPLQAPADYNRQADRDKRLHVLGAHLEQLRTAVTGDGFRREPAASGGGVSDGE